MFPVVLASTPFSVEYVFNPSNVLIELVVSSTLSAAHPVIDGRSYADVRCSQGVIAEELGLDGSCPLCDSMAEVWELYNKEYADICKTRCLDPKSVEAQTELKQDIVVIWS